MLVFAGMTGNKDVIFLMIVSFAEKSMLHCYRCLATEILTTDRSSESTAPDTRDTLINLVYGGEDPGSCHHPTLTKCTQDQVCTYGRFVVAGNCKYPN